MIKSTYSLDLETVRKVERLAARWQVSKSEVLRRAVAVAAKNSLPEDLTPLAALRKVQEELKLTAAQARAWEAEVKRNRRAAFRKREWLRP